MFDNSANSSQAGTGTTVISSSSGHNVSPYGYGQSFQTGSTAAMYSVNDCGSFAVNSLLHQSSASGAGLSQHQTMSSNSSSMQRMNSILTLSMSERHQQQQPVATPNMLQQSSQQQLTLDQLQLTEAHQNDLNGEKRLETIHSGHFMVSEIDDTEGEQLDQSAENNDTVNPPPGIDCKLELPPQLEPLLPLQDDCVVVNTVGGPSCYRSASVIRIDNSLSKLFQCMSLAYESKLTSPKWKTFKGLKLKLRDKIRLNNMIWRAWHMQCKFKKLVIDRN